MRAFGPPLSGQWSQWISIARPDQLEVLLDLRASLLLLAGGGRDGRWRGWQLVQVLLLCLPVVLVRFVPPAVPEADRRPEAFVVGVVDGVRVADEPDARAGVGCTPGLFACRSKWCHSVYSVATTQ